MGYSNIRKTNYSASVTVKAEKNNITVLINFTKNFFIRLQCPCDKTTNFCIAVDELAANICSYAYPDGTVGVISLKCEYNAAGGKYIVTLSDKGKPFDPLAAPTADILSPVGKRAIGGLGIYIVRKLMDEIGYDYRGGCNIIRLIQKE